MDVTEKGDNNQHVNTALLVMENKSEDLTSEVSSTEGDTLRQPELVWDEDCLHGKRMDVEALTITESNSQTSAATTIELQIDTRAAPQQSHDDGDPHDDERVVDFGIEPGTLELVTIQKKRLVREPRLPLPAPPPDESPILQEFSRNWHALRLREDALTNGTNIQSNKDQSLSPDQSLLKNYEPRFTPGEPTFPLEIDVPVLLQSRVAVDEAQAFLVTPYIRFALGMVFSTIEPLYCRLIIYDLYLGCRVSEEFSFELPMGDPSIPFTYPKALFYTLPNHLPQHLYLVLKVSKVLQGDSDAATAPYCNPDKLSSVNEQQKLVEKATDCFRRLGRYRQPLAWGAIALTEGPNRPMSLYRQRNIMHDDQRLTLISEAVRGTLKERLIPAVCEINVERIDEQRIDSAKFTHQDQTIIPSGEDEPNRLSALPTLDICDPFSFSRSVSIVRDQDTNPYTSNGDPTAAVISCTEVQPFCHPSVMPVFGPTGCGPVAVSYINTLYLYPVHLEKFQFRNIAIRVQLLQEEIRFVCGIEDLESQSAVLAAVYTLNHGVCSSAYTHVNYHQKNPQFEHEIKICLPENLMPEHHILLTFYHVHCKKLQPNQQQQDIVGYAALPLLQKDGTIIQDSNHVLNVFPTPIPSSKNSTTGGVINLPRGYVSAARDAGLDSAKTTFTCRSRLLSSVHSQDRFVSAFLQPFHSINLANELTAHKDDKIVNRLLGLRQASTINARFFFFPIANFTLGHMRFGSPIVRWAAFRAFLAVLEKASWTPHRSLKAQAERNHILHQYIQVVFDEHAINDPNVKSKASTNGDNVPFPSVATAIMSEWLHVLQENPTIEDNIDTKRSSLTFSSVLLQLILKSMAIHLLARGTSGQNNHKPWPALPLVLSKEDERLAENLLTELIACVANASFGLLLQKEVNRSIAMFCRGLFLVTKNALPARIIYRYMQSINEHQSGPNVLVHLLFPFFQILIDFEYFAVVNGAKQSLVSSYGSQILPSPSLLHQSSSWLAKLIVEMLLHVVDTQLEEKIRQDSMRLLRRMFVAQTYNPRHQTADQQERIALLYFPLFASFAHFTADGKLLCSNHPNDAKNHELKKELLISVAHLLSSVSAKCLAWFFHSFKSPHFTESLSIFAGINGREKSDWNQSASLSPTTSLMHYRRIVKKQNQRVQQLTKKSFFNICMWTNNIDGGVDERVEAVESTPFDEVRVHACLELVRHLIETFLVDDIPSSLSKSNTEPTLWQYLLSPDLGIPERRLSLLDIEHQLSQRRVTRHRATAGSVDEALGKFYSPSSTGNRSPNAKAVGGSSSGTSGFSVASSGVNRHPNHKSLPRNWGKNYNQAQRRTSGSIGSIDGRSGLTSSNTTGLNSSVRKSNEIEEDTDSYDENIHALHHILAGTVLRAIQTAIDEFEWIIRLIETPSDPYYSRRRECDNALDRIHIVNVDQAFALLGSITDILFLLVKHVSMIECLTYPTQPMDGFEEEQQCESFLVELFLYLESFLRRFQKALFACRITELVLIHDESRIELLLSIAATAKSSIIRHRAAAMLCKVIFVCYDQTGSFSLVKKSIIKVLTANFFNNSLGPGTLSTESLCVAIDEMRQYSFASDHITTSFQLQFLDLVNSLSTQVKVYELWRDAIADPQQMLRDYEEIEEGCYTIMQSISPYWLLAERQRWMDALIRLHLIREKYAEAACCKLDCINFTQLSETQRSAGMAQWIVSELYLAREYAEKANWIDLQISISERLFVELKAQKRYREYQETLQYLDKTMGLLAADGGASIASTSGFTFYRVKYTGDCISSQISKNEYIYKRNKFTSLGEFVSEMRAMLRAKYPLCERVDIVPESKPLHVGDDQPNVIFMRITTVEEAKHPVSEASKSSVFQFAIPFTLSGSSSYGRTFEQMKRITYLYVAHAFPCMLNRQVVCRRFEEVRCPIDNSMDDIRKRCGLLQDEIVKETEGRTDLKTLTLVLKGSVDTHVHGGIPEVLESFLASSNGRGSTASMMTAGPLLNLPSLMNFKGEPMNVEESWQKRHELANLLVRFLQLCWRCLLISREAFRRSNQAQHPSSSTELSLTINSTTTAINNSGSTKLLNPGGVMQATIPVSTQLFEDDTNVSPLQLEFERSFAVLVDLVHTKVPFPYEHASEILQLQHQLQFLRRTAGNPTT